MLKMLRDLDWGAIAGAGIVSVPYLVYILGGKNNLAYLRFILKTNRNLYDCLKEVEAYMRKRANEIREDLEELERKEG